MYCKYCGKEITDSHFNNGVCPACMTRMANEYAQQQNVTYTQNEPASYEQKNIAPKSEIQPTEQMGYTPEFEASSSEQVYHSPENQKNPRMLGFGKALAGTIIGFVGFVLTIVIYFFAVMSPEIGMEDPEAFIGIVVIISLLIVPAFVTTLLPLIFGINSIKTFRRATGPKPIATLILGINSVYFAGMSALYLVLSFLMLFVGLMSL